MTGVVEISVVAVAGCLVGCAGSYAAEYAYELIFSENERERFHRQVSQAIQAIANQGNNRQHQIFSELQDTLNGNIAILEIFIRNDPQEIDTLCQSQAKPSEMTSSDFLRRQVAQACQLRQSFQNMLKVITTHQQQSTQQLQTLDHQLEQLFNEIKQLQIEKEQWRQTIVKYKHVIERSPAVKARESSQGWWCIWQCVKNPNDYWDRVQTHWAQQKLIQKITLVR